MLFQLDRGTARTSSKASLPGQEAETGPDGPVMSFARILILPLFATGAMNDPRRRDAMLGIGAAMTRGRTDQQQCSATLLSCDDAVNKVMRERPGTFARRGEPGLQILACTERDPACPRATRCLGPDALPF